MDNIRRVTRLQGELYQKLKQDADNLKIKPARHISNILELELTLIGEKGVILHPLTESYLSTHSPKQIGQGRAKILTLTGPSFQEDKLNSLAYNLACLQGAVAPCGKQDYFAKDNNQVQKSPYYRSFTLKFFSCKRQIQTSCLLNYLERNNLLH